MMPFPGKLEPNILKEDIARKEVITVYSDVDNIYDLIPISTLRVLFSLCKFWKCACALKLRDSQRNYEIG